MSNKNNLAKVYHFDLYGKREDKYEFLNENSLDTIEWNELAAEEPNFFFVKKNFEGAGEYEKGFKIDELFIVYNNGIETGKDSFFYSLTSQELINKLQKAFSNKPEAVVKFEITNTDSFKFLDKLNASKFDKVNIRLISYRPFDIVYGYYDRTLQRRPAFETMKILFKTNLGLLVPRQVSDNFKHVFISKYPTDCNLTSTAKKFGSAPIFPLYLYPEISGQQSTEQTTSPAPPKEGYSLRKPNLNPAIVQEIAKRLGLEFVEEKTPPNLPKGEELRPSFGGVGEVKKEGLSQPGYVTANPKTYKLIKEMRDSLKDNPTEAEKVMWEYLRNKKTGYKIRRQHIIDNFITDFVCLSKKVVIEIDGKIHLKQKEYDELRTAKLTELDYEVIRFTNEDVFTNPELVASKIKQKLDTKIDFLTDDILNSTPLAGLGEVFNPPLEGPGEVFTPPLEGLGEVFNPPLEGLGEVFNPPLEGPGEVFTPPLEGPGEVFAPIDILDYIYAVLHSPTYREKYKEFLKIDFPRVPYPKDQGTFWQLVKLGGELRQIHLLESPIVEKYITQYNEGGDNMVTKISFSLCPSANLETPAKSSPEERTSEELSFVSSTSPLGRPGGVLIPVGNVYINETQYFGNVPEVAWNFYIGGYQPAQKWLKDRKGRELSFEDILHYQKIIVALTETDRIMKEIDEINIIEFYYV